MTRVNVSPGCSSARFHSGRASSLRVFLGFAWAGPGEGSGEELTMSISLLLLLSPSAGRLRDFPLMLSLGDGECMGLTVLLNAWGGGGLWAAAGVVVNAGSGVSSDIESLSSVLELGLPVRDPDSGARGVRLRLGGRDPVFRSGRGDWVWGAVEVGVGLRGTTSGAGPGCPSWIAGRCSGSRSGVRRGTLARGGAPGVVRVAFRCRLDLPGPCRPTAGGAPGMVTLACPVYWAGDDALCPVDGG